MTRRRVFTLFVVMAVVAVAAFLWPRGPKEPAYQGRGLGSWIRDSLDSPDPGREEKAYEAIEALGTNALPYLIHEFSRRESGFSRRFNRFARTLNLPGTVRAETEYERVSWAAMGLYGLRSNALPALPALAAQLDDPIRGGHAAAIIGQCGDRGLQYLRRALHSTNEQTVLFLLDGIVTASDEDDLCALILALGLVKHTNHHVRLKAVLALELDSHSDAVLPLFVEALKDSDPDVRRAAVDALGNLEGKARPALPELIRLATNSTPQCPVAVSNAILRIDRAALVP